MEGTPFGRYRLQHMIGRGGMGEVWRAFDTETHRVVAIKVLPAQLAADEEFTERFRREARVAAGLNSPHIVPIHYFGEIDGRLYVDMQVIDGHDLQAVLESGPMPPERAVRVIEQVASALRTAHNAGLVHRDVKPSNILLNADDFAYLIDFGLARTDDDSGLTVTGHTVGTFAYMAPERYEGRPADHRTDVYSLACVLFQCLTGRRPFTGSGAQQMLAHVSTPPPRPTASIPNLPPGFDTVIAIGMAKDVERRYPNISEFARAAREALAGPRTRSYDQSYPPSHPGNHRGALTPAHLTGPPTQAWQQPPSQYGPQAPLPAAFPAQTAQWSGSPVTKKRPWWRRKSVIVGSVGLVVASVAVTAIALTTSGGPSATVTGPPDGAVTVADTTYLPQTNLNSEGLYKILAITANQGGSIVGLCCLSSLFKTPQDDSKAPEITPLNLGTGVASSIAVDDQGNGYFATTGGEVLRLDGALKPTKLPFPPTDVAIAIGVDAGGDVFVMHQRTQPVTTLEVLKWEYGSQSTEVLPFDNPNAKHMAVAPDGTVYVDNLNSGTILKLDAGANRPTGLVLPKQEGSDAAVYPRGLAAGGDGAVYLAAEGADGNKVYRYAPGERTADALPIQDLQWDAGSVVGLTVDAEGSVYVVDQAVHRIVKLARYEG